MGSLQVQTKASHASTLGEPLSAHGICYIVGYIDPRAKIINPKLNSFQSLRLEIQWALEDGCQRVHNTMSS